MNRLRHATPSPRDVFQVALGLSSLPARNETPAAIMSKSSAIDRTRIVFISTMTSGPWGGSEELWSGAALTLAAEGYAIFASVRSWPTPHRRLRDLAAKGVKIQLREATAPLWRRAYRKLSAQNETQDERDIISLLRRTDPALVVLSDGNCMPPISVLRYCVAERIPFVTVGHMSSEYFGIDDAEAAHYRDLLPMAQRCYFVCSANLRTFEKQTGCVLPNAEIVRNPFKVAYDASPAWPPLQDGDMLRLAHVGRLHAPSKGQDILVEALAGSAWRSRNWRLTFYGDGPMRDIIDRLVQRFGLSDQIQMGGFVESVEQIWRDNHLLVMSSRYEGLPLAIVEAMLCSRPVLATDVAGHAEVIDDGITGFIAAYPNPRSLAEALERVWQNRYALETMGARAGVAIRARVPRDPVKAFAEKVKVAARADQSRGLYESR